MIPIGKLDFIVEPGYWKANQLAFKRGECCRVLGKTIETNDMPTLGVISKPPGPDRKLTVDNFDLLDEASESWPDWRDTPLRRWDMPVYDD